jgi:hypothetical protein
MANPVIHNITAETWVKVATGVTVCMVHIMTNNGFSQTYRLTGHDAPTNLSDAVKMHDKFLQFSASASSDLYIYSHCDNGKVRVDI